MRDVSVEVGLQNCLADASVSLSEASRLFGVPIGRNYIQLKGNRAGQCSMTLTGNYRLIVEKFQEDEASLAIRVIVM